MSSPERIGELLFRYTRKKLSKSENDELLAWRNSSPKREELFKKETDPEHLRREMSILFESEARAYQKFQQRHPEVIELKPRRTHSRLFYITRIAAAVFTVFVLGAIFFSPATKNLEPGSYRAELVSFGSISGQLSDMRRGFLDGYSGIKIVDRSDGKIVCIVPNKTKDPKSKYYTLVTPIGGMLWITFPDNTAIWLNAGSEITYPANFSQDSIVIKIDGEAYFELAPQSKFSYYIQTDSIMVKPMEAHFDIRAYPQEPLTLTLLKGNAKVHMNQKYSGVDSSDLSVSEGGYVSVEGNIMTTNQKSAPASTNDLQDVIAWKNDRTIYHNAPIQRIMSDIARWYNAEVIYEGNIPDKLFNLDLPRNAKFPLVEDALRRQGVHFKVKKRTVTINF